LFICLFLGLFSLKNLAFPRPPDMLLDEPAGVAKEHSDAAGAAPLEHIKGGACACPIPPRVE